MTEPMRTLLPAWPELPYAAWKETAATLQLYTQIIGKVRTACTPCLNHSWHVVLYVTARGLTTSPIPYGERIVRIDFDFIDHCVDFAASDGLRQRLILHGQCVADFCQAVGETLTALKVPVPIHGRPNAVADAILFAADRTHCRYDREYEERFWRALLQTDRVFKYFRTGFLGKASPVHFFWGSFAMAVTGFSGRPAPAHPGGVPNLLDIVAGAACSHEVSSAGFWPGGGAAKIWRQRRH